MADIDFQLPDIGAEAYRWASELFPVCRSLTGEGTRTTLRYIQSLLPGMVIESIPSGTKVFDWAIPPEWNIRSATLTDPSDRTIADFSVNNLHVVGYSTPVDVQLPLEQLDKYLHSLPELPDAIPYVTSYYERTWGFCLPHRVRAQLIPGLYRARIDATLAPGHLHYGELILKGETSQEVLLSTYVCHPSMANNELSGPVVTAALARWLSSAKRRYTYRVVFTPETIGSIAYLARHLPILKRNMIAGYVVTCVGDNRTYSYLESRNGNTLADRAAVASLSHHVKQYDFYSYLDRGSDERQYCAPGVDLPVAVIMRSKFGTYPEYHTSLDDLTVISAEGLQGSFDAIAKAILIIENNDIWQSSVLCEPQLGRRGLYPQQLSGQARTEFRIMLNVLAYADGTRDLIDLSAKIQADPLTVARIANRLADEGVLAKQL